MISLLLWYFYASIVSFLFFVRQVYKKKDFTSFFREISFVYDYFIRAVSRLNSSVPLDC